MCRLITESPRYMANLDNLGNLSIRPMAEYEKRVYGGNLDNLANH